MSEMLGDADEKRKSVKELLRRLHEGADPEEVRDEFRDAIKGLTPLDIARIEEELIKEGMPPEEIQKFCDLHLSVLREAVEGERPSLPPWHPVYILIEEHRMQMEMAEKLREVARRIAEAGSFENAADALGEAKRIAKHLREAEKHYLREENVLFPYLEKHGVTQPPAIMWMEHDRIRETKRAIYAALENPGDFREFAKALMDHSLLLNEMFVSHFYKENNVLFPTALRLFSEEEWRATRKEFDEVGYCCFVPEPMPDEALEVGVDAVEGMVSFETGTLTKEQLEGILNTLPVDITFVDSEDTVRYFNQSKDRIFIRTKAVIGRKVQQCHPQKSIDVVNRIIDDFRNGRRDVAEFWINMGGRLIYIRYFPVRNAKGEYLGVLEVTQDITDIKKIEGEKRLLDE